jgi:hypothetical protein
VTIGRTDTFVGIAAPFLVPFLAALAAGTVVGLFLAS